MKKNNYLKKFFLNGKVAVVVGGYGLMGYEISKALNDAGAKVVILDLSENNKKKIRGINFIKFDCKNYQNFENELKNIKKKIGFPQIYINASYPSSKDWASNTFEAIT